MLFPLLVFTECSYQVFSWLQKRDKGPFDPAQHLSVYGFDQQGWYGMFVACGIWCLADVSSVSPSSEQTVWAVCSTKG